MKLRNVSFCEITLWFNSGGADFQSVGVHGIKSEPTVSKYCSAKIWSVDVFKGRGKALKAFITTEGSSRSGESTNVFESLPKIKCCWKASSIGPAQNIEHVLVAVVAAMIRVMRRNNMSGFYKFLGEKFNG